MSRLLLFCALFLLTGCENALARQFGEDMSVELPCGEKLFNITWKYHSFWYATRPMREDEAPETYTFREKPATGNQNGPITVVECR